MQSAAFIQARTLLFGVATITTLWGLGALSESWGRELGTSRQPYALVGFTSLLLIAAIGRVLLAWLPPGFPGESGISRRDSGGLLATWAASHLLGVVAIAAFLTFQPFLTSQLGIPAALCTWSAALALLALLALSMATAPSAMIPRHGMPGIERPSTAAKALRIAATIVGAAPLALCLLNEMRPLTIPTLEQGPLSPQFSVFRALSAEAQPSALLAIITNPLTSAAAFAATLVLLSHALTAAHIGPLTRRAVVLLFALLPAGLASVTASAHEGFIATTPILAMLLTGATALGYTSLRRADRRAATLSIIAFTALPFLAPAHLAGSTAGMALAGLLSLLILTPRTGRARLAKPLFAAIAITISAGILRFPSDAFAPLAIPSGEDTPPLTSILTAAFAGYRVDAFGILFGLIDATGFALLLRRPWRTGGGPPGANLPRPELAFVFMVALLAWVLPMGVEVLVEGYFPAARNLWIVSMGQVLVLLAGPGLLMVATSLPALFPRPLGTSPA